MPLDATASIVAHCITAGWRCPVRCARKLSPGPVPDGPLHNEFTPLPTIPATADCRRGLALSFQFRGIDPNVLTVVDPSPRFARFVVKVIFGA